MTRGEFLLGVGLLLNLTGAVFQGCPGARPVHAASAGVGDQVAEPLWKIANACERIARALEEKRRDQ